MKENKNWKKQIALFLISQNLSMFGSSVVGFSIVWYITVTTESGFWITLSTLATLIPQVLVSLWQAAAGTLPGSSSGSRT